jgi:hypothetical protein
VNVKLKIICSLIVLPVILPLQIHGQAVTGTIVGVVTDPTGWCRSKRRGDRPQRRNGNQQECDD